MTSQAKAISRETMYSVNNDPGTLLFVGRHYVEDLLGGHFDGEEGFETRELTDEEYEKLGDYVARSWDRAYLFEQINSDITEFAEALFKKPENAA